MVYITLITYKNEGNSTQKSGFKIRPLHNKEKANKKINKKKTDKYFFTAAYEKYFRLKKSKMKSEVVMKFPEISLFQ